ncbi:hypothetical protein V6N11_059865 [Hibiscus sabdariffa]|uniref:Uncharacterized protein n=2 Tax=Hibiscus sabdariffa TaxID=183260 RepID=A0ABR2BG28_9ROSI
MERKGQQNDEIEANSGILGLPIIIILLVQVVYSFANLALLSAARELFVVEKMLSFHIDMFPNPFSPNCVEKIDNNSHNMLSISNVTPSSLSHSYNTWPFPVCCTSFFRTFTFFAILRKFSSDSNSDPYPDIPGPESCLKSEFESETGNKDRKFVVDLFPITKMKNRDKKFATTIPKNTRLGCRSEAVGVKDFIHDSLEQTFESIRQQIPEAF